MSKMSNESLSLDMIGVYPEHWQEMTLSDVCTQVTDGTHDSPKEVERGFPLVTGKSIKNRRIDFSIPYNISEEDHQKVIARSKAERDDILFANIGNSIGDLVRVQTDLEFSIKNVALFKPNQGIINPRFLEYYLFSTQVQSFVKNSSKGSAQPFIGLASLRGFPVSVPPRQEQNDIARVLGDVDDKIELNRQANQTLEQMAQAIFKSWFVDFEPVKAKIAALEAGGSENDALLAAMQVISGKDPQQLTQLQTESPEHYATLRATAELFPNSLIESELGDIPEGWENFKMIDLVSQIKPGTNYQPKRQEGGIPFVNGKHVQDGFLDFSKGIKYITQEEYERVHKSWKPEVNDVLITRIGTLGRVAIVTEYDLPMAVHYNSIIIKEGVIKHPFIFFLLRSDYFQHFYHLYKKQAVQEFVTIDAVEGIQVCLPIKKSVLNGLTKIFDEFLFKLRVNHCESNTLAQLRDTLLPKLLSGELSVNQDAG